MIPQGEAVVGAIGRRTRSRGREKAEVEELSPQLAAVVKIFLLFSKNFCVTFFVFRANRPPRKKVYIYSFKGKLRAQRM
jgi:hypothetical protein